ncbi:hypothetical protein JB92DRAFT_3097170 [Gautieria morchelliformis]|nr:hypothetical protein JB92DRAFT_3097170 [Gautieria morchelliformis]
MRRYLVVACLGRLPVQAARLAKSDGVRIQPALTSMGGAWAGWTLSGMVEFWRQIQRQGCTNRHEFTPFLTSIEHGRVGALPAQIGRRRKAAEYKRVCRPGSRSRPRVRPSGQEQPRHSHMYVVVLWAAAAPAGHEDLRARVVDWKTNED